MTTLLFATARCDDAAEPTGRLGRSLAQQTDSRWRRGPDLAAAEWVVLVDEDTKLKEDAVEIMVAALESHPAADALFGDAIVDGRRVYRPGWSAIRVLGEPADLTMLVVRGSLLSRAERGPVGLAARLTAAAEIHRNEAEVLHVPSVLSEHPAPGELSPTEHLALSSLGHSLRPGTEIETSRRPGTFRLKPPDASPDISVVIPTAGGRDQRGVPIVRRAVEAVVAESPTAEILLVVGDELDGQSADLVAEHPVKIVERPAGAFNFAAAINEGVLAAENEFVLLLNDDTELLETGWLARLAVHLGDPGLSAVAPALLYPNHTIQHIGVVIDDARPLHPLVGKPLSAAADAAIDIARDVVAASAACLLVRRRDFLAVGGMSLRFPLSFNDIDLCLKFRRAGSRVIVEPAASLLHHESLSRSPTIAAWEWNAYIERWGNVIDPWYHPAYVRPDDPEELSRNADHIRPPVEVDSRTPRDTRVRPAVHHSRLSADPAGRVPLELPA